MRAQVRLRRSPGQVSRSSASVRPISPGHTDDWARVDGLLPFRGNGAAGNAGQARRGFTAAAPNVKVLAEHPIARGKLYLCGIRAVRCLA